MRDSQAHARAPPAPLPPQASSVGLYAKAGSRYETTPGTASVLERVAYASTQKRSGLKLHRDAEDLGTDLQAKASRESFVYSADSLRSNVEAVTEMIAEAATAPKLRSWEVAEARPAFAGLVAERAAAPATVVAEGVFAAAFGVTSPLGHSQYVSPEGLGDVSADTLRAFLGATFKPSTMTFAATNVSHAAAVELATQYFGALPGGAGGVTAKPVYTGGESMTRTAGGGAHVAIAFPAPSLASGKAVQAAAVLQALLGASTPRGAVGAAAIAKQSRLARSTHTEAHSFIRSIAAFSTPLSDAGLLGITGTCADSEAGRLLAAAIGFMKDAAGVAATAGELSRAKTAVKLAAAGQVDTRAGAREALGQAVLATGAAPSLAEVFAAIDAVTAADVQAVARAALAAPPSVSAVGSLVMVPRYDQVLALLK